MTNNKCMWNVGVDSDHWANCGEPGTVFRKGMGYCARHDPVANAGKPKPLKPPPEPGTPEEIAAALILGGWYQISYRYRTVARLPDGMTGIKALEQVDHIRNPEWARRLGEQSAGDHWLRCYATGDRKKSVDRETFIAFRRLGGGTYLDKGPY